MEPARNPEAYDLGYQVKTLCVLRVTSIDLVLVRLYN
jgi:hypothetical protein